MPNKIYTTRETAVTFLPNPLGASASFKVQNLPTQSGYVSNRLDLGVSSRSSRFEWRATTQISGIAPALGEAVEIYLSTSDGSIADGAMPSGETMIGSQDKKRNLKYVGALVADVAATGTPFNSSGRVTIDGRYVSAVWFNGTVGTLHPATGVHQFILTPIPDEIQ
jgi:hypothetical protein